MKFYGDDVADAFTALLQDHVTGTLEVVRAARGGDATRLSAAKVSWYAGADRIVAFIRRGEVQALSIAAGDGHATLSHRAGPRRRPECRFASLDHQRPDLR